jgi:hypothetical protein
VTSGAVSGPGVRLLVVPRWSDVVKSRKLPIIVCTIVQVLALALMLYLPQLNVFAAMALCFAFGAGNAARMLAFSTAADVVSFRSTVLMQGKVIVRRRLKRYVLAFFQKLPPCLVGIEACASSRQNAVLAALRTDRRQHAPTRFSSAPQCLLQHRRERLVGCDQPLAFCGRIDRNDRWAGLAVVVIPQNSSPAHLVSTSRVSEHRIAVVVGWRGSATVSQ